LSIAWLQPGPISVREAEYGRSRQSPDLPKVKSPLRVEIESGPNRAGSAVRVMLLDQEAGHYGAAAELACPALLRVLISCRGSRRPYLTASLVMSETLSADDPYARTAQVYPKLPAEVIPRVGAYG